MWRGLFVSELLSEELHCLTIFLMTVPILCLAVWSSEKFFPHLNCMSIRLDTCTHTVHYSTNLRIYTCLWMCIVCRERERDADTEWLQRLVRSEHISCRKQTFTHSSDVRTSWSTWPAWLLQLGDQGIIPTTGIIEVFARIFIVANFIGRPATICNQYKLSRRAKHWLCHLIDELGFSLLCECLQDWSVLDWNWMCFFLENTMSINQHLQYTVRLP